MRHCAKYCANWSMRHCVKFDADGRTIVEIWLFKIFQDVGRPPSWIFKSWKF